MKTAGEKMDKFDKVKQEKTEHTILSMEPSVLIVQVTVVHICVSLQVIQWQ